MRVSVLSSIDSIPAADWNALAGDDYPFLRHEFLAALEHNGCVGEELGWIPSHLVAYDGRIPVGAVPLYQKFNSYGEFVFDWSWADAYEQAGVAYYPKLVAAAPYTPATGPRILVAETADWDPVADALIAKTLELVNERKQSSLHWLFTTDRDTERLEDKGFMRRIGCQFHWENQAYEDFDEFLSGFGAQKRKKLRRERRYVKDAGLALRVVPGNEATPKQFETMNKFYQSIYRRKWGFPTLNLGFFREIGASMGESIVMVFAYDEQRPVAGAFNLRGRRTLYGRHWGCNGNYHSLHFETCYYQGIEYCIRHGLHRFEPGAQGEHKISRGFLPTATWSAHWIADPRFRAAIAHYVDRESDAVKEHIRDLAERSPYKKRPCSALTG